MYNINGLQKVCDILLENPSWTIAHLMAFFNLTEYINHPKVLEVIDEPDYATQMTPIQVSVLEYLKMVHNDNKKLLKNTYKIDEDSKRIVNKRELTIFSR